MKSLTISEAEALARAAFCVKYKSGEIVFTQGDLAGSFFVVLRGAVDVFTTYERKEKQADKPPIRRTFVSYQKAVHLFGRRVATVERQNFFGEVALIDGTPRTATVVSGKDAYLLQIEPALFHAVLAEHLTRDKLSGPEALEPFLAFDGLPKDMLRSLCYCFQRKHYQPRRKLLVQGPATSDSDILFLAQGTVAEFVDPLYDSSGSWAVGGKLPRTSCRHLLALAHLYPGSTIGDSCLVVNRILSTFVAVNTVTVYQVSKSDLQKRLPLKNLELLIDVAASKSENIRLRLLHFAKSGKELGGNKFCTPGERLPGLSTEHYVNPAPSSITGLALYQLSHVAQGHDLYRLQNMGANANQEAETVRKSRLEPKEIYNCCNSGEVRGFSSSKEPQFSSMAQNTSLPVVAEVTMTDAASTSCSALSPKAWYKFNGGALSPMGRSARKPSPKFKTQHICTVRPPIVMSKSTPKSLRTSEDEAAGEETDETPQENAEKPVTSGGESHAIDSEGQTLGNFSDENNGKVYRNSIQTTSDTQTSSLVGIGDPGKHLRRTQPVISLHLLEQKERKAEAFPNLDNIMYNEIQRPCLTNVRSDYLLHSDQLQKMCTEALATYSSRVPKGERNSFRTRIFEVETGAKYNLRNWGVGAPETEKAREGDNLRLHDAREPRDDIHAALSLGIPLAALLDTPPDEVLQTVPKIPAAPKLRKGAHSLQEPTATCQDSQGSPGHWSRQTRVAVQRPATTLSPREPPERVQTHWRERSKTRTERVPQRSDRSSRLGSRSDNAIDPKTRQQLRKEVADAHRARNESVTRHTSHYRPWVPLWATQYFANAEGEDTAGASDEQDRPERRPKSSHVGVVKLAAWLKNS
mmetsp:Transcript_13695/g.32449  ORF Transcript_13695/g.32449 Transcript_13695/m.32449 type:complete len:863 (-) Transcript_13695:76-2664(-)